MTRRRTAVLGDLVVDVVLLPDAHVRRGTDVAGRVELRQGGSAATTARWLARLGLATDLVTALGQDQPGQWLAAALASAGVTIRGPRRSRWRTGWLGVIVEADGERSFVADRGAILHLAPHHLRAAWFSGLDLLHLPAYSLLAPPLAEAALAAGRWIGQAGGAISVDLASAGFLERFGPEAVLERVAALQPQVVLATADESAAAVRGGPERLLDLAPLVVLKEGASGARALRRGAPPVALGVRPAPVVESTGAGDAFDAGFLAAWLEVGSARPPDSAGPPGSARPLGAGALRRCLRAGHAAARREVTGPRRQLSLS